MTTVVTRAGKGSAITYAEMDVNLTNLNTDKAETNNPTFTGIVGIGRTPVNFPLEVQGAIYTPTGCFYSGATGSDSIGDTTVANLRLSNTQLQLNAAGNGLDVWYYSGGWQKLFKFGPGGSLHVNPLNALGYGAGAGGTVTQATSKNTKVTLHKPCGQITTAPDSLAPGASSAFVLDSSLISTGDQVLVNIDNNGNYSVECLFSTSGGAGIKLTNTTGGALAEAVGINFAIIKGATS